eukprot:3343635-Pyramimonas_sp.AAC.2
MIHNKIVQSSPRLGLGVALPHLGKNSPRSPRPEVGTKSGHFARVATAVLAHRPDIPHLVAWSDALHCTALHCTAHGNPGCWW